MYHFMYEDDLGTETKDVWQAKIKAHLDFRSSGLSEQHYGTRNYRLLMRHLKQWTEEVGGMRFPWFTTGERLNIWQPTTFLDPIWQMAGESGEFELGMTGSRK
ncbi:hypothetical protein KFU94_38115 [Chloroflexi bacterium TSY]|nr:hypothetical protein [Chloroflexi bacterium TSY]